MKVGDRLYCYNIDVNHFLSYTIGNFYEIVRLEGWRVYIIGDNGKRDWFFINCNNKNDDDYNNYFYTITELRKIKLDKLEHVFNLNGSSDMYNFNLNGL